MFYICISVSMFVDYRVFLIILYFTYFSFIFLCCSFLCYFIYKFIVTWLRLWSKQVVTYNILYLLVIIFLAKKHFKALIPYFITKYNIFLMYIFSQIERRLDRIDLLVTNCVYVQFHGSKNTKITIDIRLT